MAYYALDELPAVEGFVLPSNDGARERLLVRVDEGTVEVALELPQSILDGRRPLGLDALCQLVEGVSHFVLFAERARRELPMTQLELELQAEVDKYVLLVVEGQPHLDGVGRVDLHDRLFGAVEFTHPEGSECGDRYRLAHALAARYTRRLERDYLVHGRRRELRAALRRFYTAGQTEKLELAHAA
jgi:hypothetical protein